MPYGKIVVIKRGGGDGTEFPLTATCVFGRKADCDIRIQLPHVSKEHCRVELNENKEVILTNMSSVNPTRVNGAELQQAERLKHGDIITIIDRSFRFEYPPQQTPKKSSVSGKTDTLQVLHEQVRTPGENRASEISTGPRLKDGTNNDNIQRSLEKTMEVEAKEDGGLQHTKTDSPFSELYQMIKHSLETPRKPAGLQPQTPATKNRMPKPQPGSITKVVVQAAVSAECQVVATAKSPKKCKKSLDTTATLVAEEKASVSTHETPKMKRLSLPAKIPTTTMEASATPKKESPATPQKVIVSEVVEKPKTPTRRKSKEATPVKPTAEEQPDQTKAAAAASVKPSPRVSPRSVERKLKAQSLQRELEANAAASEKIASKKRETEAAASPRVMRKRVSFGGHLSPELFDKRLPPSSPLQKGATPRRSLNLARPKQSLLRRSAVGLFKEFEVKSPKAKSPAKKSPKAKTPSPSKKSPKVKTPSPKTPSSAKKSPKAKSDTPQPKNQPQLPSMSPTVNGRFSVSRVSTPSPVPEQETATPKVPLRRKSMKSVSRKTPKSVLKNAMEVLRRRSGGSRASIKVVNSWADIVKFGQTKSQVVAPSKKLAAIQRKVRKAVVAKPKTPARKNLKGHVTTGHADSPVTIVVGKAFKQSFSQPAGAAPKLVHNIPLLNMKMDEDLTGITEIFSTPVNASRRKSSVLAKTATQTPSGALSTSVVEMSVMNTPEETGEMLVSPLDVISATKRSVFNSEAVQRLLLSEEGSSFTDEAPALDVPAEASCQDVDTKETAPKQKPARRIPRTPKQKAEPIEDLRGKLLKTPKQKPQQPDCLSDVKRIMKTPRQKSEPIEDLRGKLLKTPKQKPQQPDCLSDVKRIMKTPRQKSEPIEDLRGKLLKTPRVRKVSGQVDLDGVKQLLETPKQRVEPVCVVSEVVVVEETLATPKETIAPVEEVVVEESLATPEETSAPVEELVVEETLATPEETIAPIEEVVVEDTLATPEETIAPIEELVVEDTLATPEETITPIEEVVVEESLATPEETIAPIEEVLVEKTLATPEETIAPVEEVVVEETLATPEETIAPVEEVVVEETLATPEETIAPVEEVVVEETLATPEETIAPVEEVVVEEALATPEETITPIEEVVVEETPLATSEEIVAPAKEVVVEEALATPEETITPIEEVVVEETPLATSEEIVAPAKEVVVEETAVVESDMATELQVVCEEPEEQEEAPCAQSEDGPADIIEVSQADMTTELVSTAAPAEEPEPVVAVETDPQEVAKQSLQEPQPEQKETDIPAKRDTALPAPEPPTKSVRGKRAKIIKPATDEEPTQEEPATPVRGRRGRQTQKTQAPSQAEEQTPVRSRRGRPAGSKNIKEPVVTSLAEVAQEETSLKPRRERNTKQAPAVEAVPETTTTTEETNDQAPPTDAVQSDTTAIPAVPSVKTESRRGRNSKQTPAVEAVPETTTTTEETNDQAPPTDVVQSDTTTAIPAVPSVKTQSRRGRNSKQTPAVEAVPETTTTTEETNDQAPPTDVVQSDTTTAIPAVPSVKTQTRRGRNAKQAPVQLTPTEPQPEEEPVPAVKVEKPRRGRKAAQQEPQVEMIHEEEETSGVVTDQLPSTDTQPKEPAPVVTVKPRRGRKVNQEAASEPEVVVVEPVKTEEQTQSPVRAKRGRPTKAKPEEQKVEEEVAIPVLPEAVVKQATEKSRRARKTKQESVEEAASEEEVKVVESSVTEEEKAPVPALKTRGRKGRQEEVVEQTTAAPAETPRRGRRQTKDEKPEMVVPPTEAQDKPAEKPKRGGRRMKAEQVVVEIVAELPEEKVEPEQAEVQEEITESTSTSAVEQPEKVVKSTRGKRAVTVPSVLPVKRGRRGAVVPPQEVAVVEEIAPLSRPGARGRAGKPSTVKIADIPVEVPAEPATKGRRKPGSHVSTTTPVETTEETVEEKVEPKKGRVSKKTKPTPKDQESLTTVEDKKMAKSVKWDLTVTHEIQTPMPVLKATRGRKAAVASASKMAAPKIVAKRKMSRGQSKAEEEDLSEISQPVKRTRKGTKVL